MQNITVKDKYDFEELANILLKNGYTITVSGTKDEEDNIEYGVDISEWTIDFEKL